MKSKQWFKSKGIWSGVLLIALGIGQMVMSQAVTPEGLETLFLGTGVGGIRQAVN
jgi:hypothetical protein